MEPSEQAYPEPVQRLMTELSRMPGVGPRTAERMAQFLLRIGKDEALQLARAIRDVKDRVRPCSECFNLTESEVCRICADPSRDRQSLCIVEQVRDLAALEAAGAYRGLYHVLTGTLSPLDGVGPEDLTIDALVERVRKGEFREVILATNPTLEGDGTAMAVASALQSLVPSLTRLATGVPSGSFLEHSNRNTLADAFAGRRPLK
ncbi:MAG: recombination mediator RecR [Planctomycetota bacterium]|jgi:recombination protein RecR